MRDDRVEVHVTGNGSSEAFSPEGPTADGERYFLFVGNLKPHKNVSVLTRALREVESDVRLRMVVPEPSAAERFVRQFGIESRVQILSGLSDAELAAQYRGALALLFPSKIEGFGLPVLEAQRSGCPVVYSESCESAREICRDGGLALPPTESGAWAAAMKEILAGLTLRVADTRGFEWSNVSRNVSGVLEALLN
ncbi:hypothetical protein GCM10027273_14680 [Nocardioides pakistanensis]